MKTRKPPVRRKRASPPKPITVSALIRSLAAELRRAKLVFAHGTTVYAHGPSTVTPTEPPPETEPEAPKRGLRKLFSAERTMKREFFGSDALAKRLRSGAEIPRAVGDEHQAFRRLESIWLSKRANVLSAGPAT